MFGIFLKPLKIIFFLIFLVIILAIIQFFVFPIFDEGILIKSFGITSIELKVEKHPFALFNKQGLEDLKNRINEEPLKSWYQKISDKCMVFSKIEDFKDKREEAYTSKLLAFCYAIENNGNYAKKAEELLLSSNKGKFKNVVSNYNDALIFYSQAYDTLKGSGWNFENEEGIRENLKELMLNRDNLPYLIFNYPSEFLGIISFDNNQEVRKQSAIGLASLTLADYNVSKKMFKNSLYGIAKVYTIQSNNVPTWGEGPTYFNYASRALLPYFLALKNYAGINLIEKIDKNFEWAYNLTMNTGELPNYDDGELTYLFWPLVKTKNNGKYLYLWENSKKRYYGLDSYWDVDIISNYYNQSNKYSFPSLVILNKTGGVFRGNNLYLLLLAERDESISKTHEHPDSLSIIFQRGEEILIGDSGYYALKDNKKQAEKVNKAINHNVILVNGRGESYDIFNYFGDVDKNSYLKHYDNGKHPFLKAFAEYENSYLERSILFFNKEYFIIFDKAISKERKTFSLLFHTIDKNPLINENTAIWKDFMLVSNYNINSFDQIVSKDRKEYLQKTLNITKKSNSALFITVLLPYGKPINIEKGSNEDYNYLILDFGNYRDIIIHNRGSSYLIDGLEGEAEIGVYRIKNNQITEKFEYG